MEEIISVIGISMAALVMTVTLREIKKEYAVVLMLTVGALLLMWALENLAPVIGQLAELFNATQLNVEYGEILMKALGVSLCTQLASDACRDAGETAIGSKVELCGKACILLLSLPLMREVISIAGSVLSI